MPTLPPPCFVCGALFPNPWASPPKATNPDSGIIRHVCACCTRAGEERNCVEQPFVDDCEEPNCGPTIDHLAHQIDHLTRQYVLDLSFAILTGMQKGRAAQGRREAPLHLLHIGCGAGDLLHQLRMRSTCALVLVGIEHCQSCAQQAQSRDLIVSTTSLEVEALPAKIGFDLIIEHNLSSSILSAGQHLAAVRSHLRSDGVFLAGTEDAHDFGENDFFSLTHLLPRKTVVPAGFTVLGIAREKDSPKGQSRAPQATFNHAPASRPATTAFAESAVQPNEWRTRLTHWLDSIQAAFSERM
jgi:hypothetical protein